MCNSRGRGMFFAARGSRDEPTGAAGKPMRRLIYVATRLALGLAALAVAGSTPATGRIPVLLELFTSEGCSSCPPADRLLATLDERQPEARAELIVLSEHVDYFNYLGWKDPFSAEVFSERQESFSGKPHFDGVYTPQLVVDGRFGFVGSDDAAASAAIRKAVQEPKIPLKHLRDNPYSGACQCAH